MSLIQKVKPGIPFSTPQASADSTNRPLTATDLTYGQCSGDIAGWRSRRTALSSNARYRETRSSVRWRLPDRRFHAFQLREFRRPQNLHPNTIQITGIKQTYSRGLAHFLLRDGRVHRNSAADEAGQRRMVPGNGRRRLPEPAKYPDRSARRTFWSWPPTTFTR